MKGLHTFFKGISLKVNVLVRLEVAYSDVAVQYINHYTTAISYLFKFSMKE